MLMFLWVLLHALDSWKWTDTQDEVSLVSVEILLISSIVS